MRQLTASQARWNSIRNNWVNGNRDDARNLLFNSPKFTCFSTVLAALQDYSDSSEPHTSNGALTDLMELLRSLNRDNVNNS